MFRWLIIFEFCLVFSIDASERLEVMRSGSDAWTTFSGVEFLDKVAPFAAQDGNLWWALKDGVVRFDGINGTKYTAEDGLMDGPVSSIAQNEDGILWFIGSHQKKAAVVSYDGQKWRLVSVADNVPGEWVGEQSTIDSNGNIWIASKPVDEPNPTSSKIHILAGNGLLHFDGQVWKNYRVEDGLAHNRVYEIATGLDGSIWVSTNRRGTISRFDGHVWKIYTRQDGSHCT